MDSGNGLSPVGCQVITWTNDESLSNVAVETNLNGIFIKKINIEDLSFAKWQLFHSSTPIFLH